MCFVVVLTNKKTLVMPLTHELVYGIVCLDDRTDLSLQQLLMFWLHRRKSSLSETLVHFFVDLLGHAGHCVRQLAVQTVQRKCKLENTGYSALPSPPRLMRRTHTQRDAERHNTFTR